MSLLKRSTNPPTAVEDFLSGVTMTALPTLISNRDLQRPQLKPSLRYQVVPMEGVVLLSEHGQTVLHGECACRLVPLLDGTHTIEEILHLLLDHFSGAQVMQALAGLHKQGCLIMRPPSLPPEQSIFWEGIGVNPEQASQRLQAMTVKIITVGDIDSSPLQALLTSLGIDVQHARADEDRSEEGSERDCWLVLAADYASPQLEAVNRKALASNTPWLLVKPVGREVWLGPLFIPEETGCWTCLAQRLKAGRKAERFLEKDIGAGSVPVPLQAALPSTLHTAWSLVATEIAKWIGGGIAQLLAGHLVTFDTGTLTTQRHVLTRRPQCPGCGDPQTVANNQTAPLVLHRRQKMAVSDGGQRSMAPEALLRQLEQHISPITGLVGFIESTADWVEEPGLVPAYVASHNFFHALRDYSPGLDLLLGSFQDGSAGKGCHPAQAKVSAVAEAIERYSGIFQGDEARLRARYQDLGDAAIHPNDSTLFSQQQFAQREEWNARGSHLPARWVAEPFDEDQEVDWSPVWPLTTSDFRYLPTAYCYYGYSWQHQTWFARGDSNGCAAGLSREEAILHGFMELVERDSVALWWYNRVSRPGVDLSSVDDPYVQQLQSYYSALQREVWVLDITSDLGIPAFAAVSRQCDQDIEGILLGFGAHFDPQLAIQRALTEMDQQLPAFSAATADRGADRLKVEPELVEWWHTARLDNQAYLAPDATLERKSCADYPKLGSNDFRTDVLTCVTLAQEQGLETLVLDQTRPDTGLCVVKVIVPGLRHFWARLGPGRLYDVPVRLGWLSQPRTEAELNPWPICF